MKKAISVLILLVVCILSVFAVNQIRTSFVPYSMQRMGSTRVDDKTFNTDYGWGLKFAYMYSLHNGITFGAEVGSYHYLLPDINGEQSDEDVGSSGMCPLLFKFGYFTPLHKEKAVRYFVYGQVGLKLWQGADKVSRNPLFGLETGFSFSLPRNFNVGVSVEPMVSFSKKESTDTKFTNFFISANVVLGYEF